MRFHDNEKIDAMLTEEFYQIVQAMKHSDVDFAKGGALRVSFEQYGKGEVKVEAIMPPMFKSLRDERLERYKRIEELQQRLANNDAEDIEEHMEIIALIEALKD